MALSDLVDILDEIVEGQIFSVDEQSFTVERFDTLDGVDGCYVSENKTEEVKAEAPVVQTEVPIINPEANEIAQEDLEAAAEKHDEIAQGNFGVDAESKRMQTQVDDAIRTIISEELYELYGSVQEFTYEIRDRQYNVKLKTGEIVVLLKSEIDSRVKI